MKASEVVKKLLEMISTVGDCHICNIDEELISRIEHAYPKDPSAKEYYDGWVFKMHFRHPGDLQ